LYEETLAFADEEQDEIYYNIGLAYQSMEKYEQAIDDVQKIHRTEY
jgi:tetratricopeptide (TPR) repeat protein